MNAFELKIGNQVVSKNELTMLRIAFRNIFGHDLVSVYEVDGMIKFDHETTWSNFNFEQLSVFLAIVRKITGMTELLSEDGALYRLNGNVIEWNGLSKAVPKIVSIMIESIVDQLEIQSRAGSVYLGKFEIHVDKEIIRVC